MRLLKYFILFIIIAGTASGQPKISVDELEHNLGVIYSGMKKVGKIVIKNIGNDTLRIFSIQPSCGCTAVKQPKEFLLPNESSEIEIEFNSAGYHGVVRKHVNIFTNDPTFQNISVQIVTDVRDELRLANAIPQLWLGEAIVGKPKMQQASFVNVSGHNMKIKGVRTSSPFLSLKIANNMLKPNDSLNVQITINASKTGYFKDDTIIIETDSKNLPEIETKVIYRVIEEKQK